MEWAPPECRHLQLEYDQYGIETVYRLCAYLPLIGLLAAFLPALDDRRAVNG